MILVIGSKTYSSWSLRPWLVLKHFGIAFEEKLILLDRPESSAKIRKFSPTGQVPALIDGDLTICESLAICEYLNDRFPHLKMWPVDLKARALARSDSHEMHAGFQKLREVMPHDLSQRRPGFNGTAAHQDIIRIQGSAGAYMETLLRHPALQQWRDEALRESAPPSSEVPLLS